MRSVFLSSLISQHSIRSQFRTLSPTSVSFAQLLDTIQGFNRATVLSRTSSQGRLREAPLQPRGSLSPLSPKEPNFFSSTPRLTRDSRFLPPLALNGSRIRSNQKSAFPGESPQQEPDSPEQAVTIRTYAETITATARQLGVDPTLSMAVARAESGIGKTKAGEVILDPRAVSSEGAVGLFQLMEATGKEQLRTIAPGQRYNPLNPSQNIQLGVSYLKEMRNAFSDDTKLHRGLSTTAGANDQEARRLAIAAYNAGPGRVARAQELARAQGRDPSHYRNIERHLPQETRQYVKKVESFAKEFRREDVMLANRSTTISTENVA